MLVVTDSYPTSANTWRIWVENTDTAPHNVTVWALCMTTDPAAVIAKVPANFTPAKKHNNR
jgi:hypothetical protein